MVIVFDIKDGEETEVWRGEPEELRKANPEDVELQLALAQLPELVAGPLVPKLPYKWQIQAWVERESARLIKEFRLQDDTGDDFKHGRSIRSLSTTRGELLIVDFDKILRGEALPLPLMQGDIVYVPRSNFGAWNDALNEMLPSLQAISTILQPFVQLKFLSEE